MSVAAPSRSGTALVTGAARRIGAAIARALHRRGLDVAVHYRTSRDDAQALARSLDRERPGTAAAFGCDLLDSGAPEGLVSDVVARFGALDVLINNASSFYPTPFGATTEDQWDDLIGTNLKAPYFLTQAAARYLTAGRGSVVNLADIHGCNPVAGYPAYCSAKAGLIMLTRALALELGPEVRRSTPSRPASRCGPVGDCDVAAPTSGPSDWFHCAGPAPPKRSPDAVTWLALDAPYTTGEVLAVDGGRGDRRGRALNRGRRMMRPHGRAPPPLRAPCIRARPVRGTSHRHRCSVKSNGFPLAWKLPPPPRLSWIPACAGMTVGVVIPAQAGIHCLCDVACGPDRLDRTRMRPSGRRRRRLSAGSGGRTRRQLHPRGHFRHPVAGHRGRAAMYHVGVGPECAVAAVLEPELQRALDGGERESPPTAPRLPRTGACPDFPRPARTTRRRGARGTSRRPG